MSNYAVIKCLVAVCVIAVYTWLFGIVGSIESDGAELEPAEFVDESPEFQDDNRQTISTKALYGDPVKGYRTTINARNDARPQLADYPAQTTPPATSTRTTTTPSEDVAAVIMVDDPDEITISTGEDTKQQSTKKTTAKSTTKASTSAENELDELDEVEESEATTTQTTAEATPSPSTTQNSASDEELWVVANGKEVRDTAFSIVSKMVQAEVGSSFNTEAIKAQVVASYTFVKAYNDYQNIPPNVVMSNVASSRVTSCVKEVLGEAIYYNGSLAQTVYCASSAGYTSSSASAWGRDYPYLRSVYTPLDATYDPNYGAKKKMSATDVMARVLVKTGIKLEGNPNDWFEIVSHVDGVYVGTMKIGGQTSYVSNGDEINITGHVFRDKIMSYDLRSPSFEIEYDESTDMFTFTTYGYGHGVGMSQNGANTLAKVEGYDYRQILEFYYPGTVIQ